MSNMSAATAAATAIVATPRFTQDELATKLAPIVSQLKQLDGLSQFSQIMRLWEMNNDFDCFRYLAGLSIQGEIQSSYWYMAPPIQADYRSAVPTLLKLNQLGVLTTEGQSSLEHRVSGDLYQQRSYLEFSMRVQETFDPLAFCSKLYDMGMQVAATVMRPVEDLHNQTPSGEDYDGIKLVETNYAFWDSLKIHGETTQQELYRKQDLMPTDSFAVTRNRRLGDTEFKSTTWVLPGRFGVDELIDFETMGWNHIFMASIVASDWNGVQCDELLLKALTE